MAASKSITIWHYILRRLLQAVPLIFGVIVLNFILIHLAPGDPALIIAGEHSDPAYLALIRSRLGLDKPLYEQLFFYISSVIRGDLGYSFTYNKPVLQIVIERIPATLLLSGSAIAISNLLGIVLGVVASRRPYSVTDNISTIGALIAYCLPTFWLGMLLILVFGYDLGLFPIGGMFSLREQLQGVNLAIDILHHLVLPAVTLGLFYMATNFRITRASMLEVVGQDYMVTAKAKGLPERIVLLRHALRNAFIPVWTITGYSIGTAIGGAVLTETVFGWPGMGRLMFDSLFARDYPVLLGMLFVYSVAVIIVNLFTDLVYAYIDPRIRYQ